MLRAEGTIAACEFEVVLRSCEFEEPYRKLAAELGVSDLVSFGPHLPYEEAIREMVSADALLLFQGRGFNHAVPAKLYEYLYAGRPIFALLDRGGETDNVLRSLGVDSRADITNAQEIAEALRLFVAQLRAGKVPMPSPEQVAPYSRRRQARRLSGVLEEVLRESAELSPPLAELR